jgi:hypothetical protein
MTKCDVPEGQPENNCFTKTQTCVNIITYPDGDPVEKSYCVNKNPCIFNQTQYLYPPIDYDGNYFQVCGNGDNSVPVATCKVTNITDYTNQGTAVLNSSDNGNSCGFNECLNNMSQTGVASITWDDENKVCSSVISCINAESTQKECTGSCNAPTNEQCCKDANGNYNGLVCTQGYYCDTTGTTCEKMWYYNNEIDPLKVDCVQSTGTGQGYYSHSACIKDACNTQGVQCCETGWDYRYDEGLGVAQCIPASLPSCNLLQGEMTYRKGGYMYCNTPTATTMAGNAYTAGCTSCTDSDDGAGVSNTPSVMPTNPNKIVTYCVCNGTQYVNLDSNYPQLYKHTIEEGCYTTDYGCGNDGDSSINFGCNNSPDYSACVPRS